MLPVLLLFVALSALLLIGGTALLFAAWRARRLAIAERIEMIAPTPGPAAAASAISRSVGPIAALVRGPTGGLKPAELREITRACRALQIPPRNGPVVFAILRMALVLVLTIAGFVLARLVMGHSPPAVRLLIPAVLAVVGWLAPGMILGHAVKQHAAAVASGLPEALELLVVCVEAGLSLEDGIDRITGELAWAQPALAEELALTSADLKILPDRDQALGNLAARIDAPSVRMVVTSMSQTLKYGTPLAQTLRVTSAELRNDALIRMEELGNRLPTLLTLPLILFIMPTIFLVIGGPAALQLMDVYSK